jgi:hypothetical protein
MGIDPDEFLLGESQTTLQASNGSAAASAARTNAGTANPIAVSPVNITNCIFIYAILLLVLLLASIQERFRPLDI